LSKKIFYDKIPSYFSLQISTMEIELAKLRQMQPGSGNMIEWFVKIIGFSGEQ